MKTYKFRPSDPYTLKVRRQLKMAYPKELANRYIRHWHPCHIMRVGGHLHYLADHAPKPIRKKWKTAFKKFIQRHRKF